ncbi:Aurofusarin biosynthesis cluster protein S [Cladobotryum mycophilum]|uniref:Aurofusarin biosynthesis cluster protein S n=1 Tax=Cladobotryum mycophilum TaxID=491253 RepID=A0ABR0S877_9HYPO
MGLGSAIPRALRTTVFLVVVGLLAQYYFGRNEESFFRSGKSKAAINTSPVVPKIHDDRFSSWPLQDKLPENATVWDIIRNDERISRFADVVGMFDDIVGGLKAPKAKFTIYAPVNEAFEREFFPFDLPWFYWKFLAGYHMGPGPVPEKALHSTGTVSSFVNADIFFTYKQRISTQQHSSGQITLNHQVGHIASAPDSAAVNGFVHYIDGLLALPNSTASVLRQRPSLSTLHDGLILSGLSSIINDTNAHVGQTLFAPTNAAFERLSAKARRFLFGPGGKPFLQALLKGHVVANRTLFSDVYFPHGDAQMVDLRAAVQASGDSPHVIELPTLHANLNLTTSVKQHEGKTQLWVTPSRAAGDTSQEDEAIPISVADIVVMDGVVHEIDTLLMPPAPEAEEGGGQDKQAHHHAPSASAALWKALAGHDKREISIEELLERLGPWVTQPE